MSILRLNCYLIDCSAPEDSYYPNFIKDVLAALRSFLKKEKKKKKRNETTARSAAFSIAAKMNPLPETKAGDVLPHYHTVLLEADSASAASSTSYAAS